MLERVSWSKGDVSRHAVSFGSKAIMCLQVDHAHPETPCSNRAVTKHGATVLQLLRRFAIDFVVVGCDVDLHWLGVHVLDFSKSSVSCLLPLDSSGTRLIE